MPLCRVSPEPERVVVEPSGSWRRRHRGLTSSASGLRLSRSPPRIGRWMGPLPPRRIPPAPILGSFIDKALEGRTMPASVKTAAAVGSPEPRAAWPRRRRRRQFPLIRPPRRDCRARFKSHAAWGWASQAWEPIGDGQLPGHICTVDLLSAGLGRTLGLPLQSIASLSHRIFDRFRLRLPPRRLRLRCIALRRPPRRRVPSRPLPGVGSGPSPPSSPAPRRFR